jgi:hypothetical protein
MENNYDTTARSTDVSKSEGRLKDDISSRRRKNKEIKKILKKRYGNSNKEKFMG